ncbi:RNA 2'-phosphotransferase [Peribacillus psychrosaccharolyticus]|uniref:RNA 2'-phosphotransferase n=1 Tax=Peribacillus psychrosaccharolyticus TaxID=1407 RepID=A0A974S2A5_PERPY|nr:RNA 2'-phosphotransferase [Peribacillus psychrosaccharolyticus]MED3743174.1 RNA 2'-phosphotransferase [Peribacillus psychrosaccharolyticus]QQT02502.1 RNA 2'-phosphotransferase [Peribacillus psychrosaccharolyticus]
MRANQGHSVHVNVPLRTVTPPTDLFHGTATNSLQSILAQGIKKMNRLYVHLSDNTVASFQVGKRHGKVVILKIDTLKMAINFYCLKMTYGLPILSLYNTYTDQSKSHYQKMEVNRLILNIRACFERDRSKQALY